MSFGVVQAEKMTTESGYSLGAGNASSFKNRIINAEMDIDQRNAGASFSATNGGYSLDRWATTSYDSTAVTGKFTVQQNAGSVTPPAGFTKYLGVTSSAATTINPNSIYAVSQSIEGFNVSDLGWGTANAKSVTLSFWVRSSLTGTFGGVFQNRDGNRTYPFTYSISSANTWEQKTVSITGDTTGTWATDNTAGIIVRFGLGGGSTWSSTAGSWQASGAYTATGAVSVVSTSGATWYVTGVQFEVGTVATSFDFRDYGRELILCQRYYEVGGGTGYAYSFQIGASTWRWQQRFQVAKRAPATVVLSSPNTGAPGYSTLMSVFGVTTDCFDSGASSGSSFGTFTASAEL